MPTREFFLFPTKNVNLGNFPSNDSTGFFHAPIDIFWSNPRKCEIERISHFVYPMHDSGEPRVRFCVFTRVVHGGTSWPRGNILGFFPFSVVFSGAPPGAATFTISALASRQRLTRVFRVPALK